MGSAADCSQASSCHSPLKRVPSANKHTPCPCRLSHFHSPERSHSITPAAQVPQASRLDWGALGMMQEEQYSVQLPLRAGSTWNQCRHSQAACCDEDIVPGFGKLWYMMVRVGCMERQALCLFGCWGRRAVHNIKKLWLVDDTKQRAPERPIGCLLDKGTACLQSRA